MAIVNQQTIYDYALAAGFSPSSAQVISGIAMAESGGNTQAKNSVGDRGIVQINNRYHPEVSDSCAYDIACSLGQAYRISNNGTNFRPWCTAWSDGACGSKGGTYLGAGSPYQRFLNMVTGSTSNATNTGAAYSVSTFQTLTNRQGVQTTTSSGPSLGDQVGSFFQYWGTHLLLIAFALVIIIIGLQFLGADPLGRTGRAIKAIAPLAAA